MRFLMGLTVCAAVVKIKIAVAVAPSEDMGLSAKHHITPCLDYFYLHDENESKSFVS